MRALLHNPWVLVSAICFVAICLTAIFAPVGKETSEGYETVTEPDDPDEGQYEYLKESGQMKSFDEDGDYDGPDFLSH